MNGEWHHLKEYNYLHETKVDKHSDEYFLINFVLFYTQNVRIKKIPVLLNVVIVNIFVVNMKSYDFIVE